MLGPRIAALRRSAGMSQAELAVKLRISPSAVGMYEQGRREPSAEQLVALSRVFGVSVDFLLTGEPLGGTDGPALEAALDTVLESAQGLLARRKDKPFTRQELAVILTALLVE